jgi:hypothetical protein
MATATKQYTQQQVRDNFSAAIARLKPAQLSATQEDCAFTERLVTQYMMANSLEPTAENFYRVFDHHMAKLPWAVKPKKLVMQEENEKPRNQNDALRDTTAFAAKLKQGEAADLQAKEDATTLKNLDIVIGGYLPIDKRGHVAYGRQAEVQSNLRAYVKKELQRKVSPSSVSEQVVAYIAKLYREDELANERV